MTPDTGKSVTDDREMIESNARRIVGVAALRRVHKLLSERRDADRIFLTLVAPVAAAVMIGVVALIWAFGSPRMDFGTAPLPECSPPRSENITV